jgi:hypothetical protein
MADRNKGVPLAVSLTAANVHDSRSLEKLVHVIEPDQAFRQGPSPQEAREAACG